MTQLDQLESEAATRRLLFADAVDGVRARIGKTADDLREKLSPGRVVRRASENWRGLIEQRARDNPLQAASAVALFAYPIWRVVRALPLPVLIAGAGVFLSGKARFSTTQANEFLADTRSKVREVGGRLADAAAQAHDSATENLESVGARVTEGAIGTTSAIHDAARSAATNVKDHLARATDSASTALANAVQSMTPSDATIQSIKDNAQATADAAGDITKRAARSGAVYSRDALSAVAQNPLLVAGLGLAAGGFLAALLPRTKADSQMLGGLARTLQDGAEQALKEGRQTATRAMSDLHHRVAETAEARGLTAEAIQGAVNDLNEQASDVAAATKRAIKSNGSIRENHYD